MIIMHCYKELDIFYIVIYISRPYCYIGHTVIFLTMKRVLNSILCGMNEVYKSLKINSLNTEKLLHL